MDLNLSPLLVFAALSWGLRLLATEAPHPPPAPPEPHVPPTPEKLRERVAYHEASHAVVGHVLGAGIRRIVMRAGGGCTFYEIRTGMVSPRNRICISLAGTIGERMRDPAFQGLWFADGGDRPDQLQAVAIADGLTKNLEDRRLELQRARNLGALILSTHWPAVTTLAETLIEISEYGTSLDGTTIWQILASVAPNEKPRSALPESLRRKQRSRDWN